MEINTGQFNDSYKPIMDGVSVTVNNYAKWLNKKYGNTIVVTPSYPKYDDEDEFDIIRYRSVPLPKKAPYRIGLPGMDFRVKSHVNNLPIDLIHAHSPFSSGKLALKIAKKRNIPIVATFHSKFYDDFRSVLKSEFCAKMALKKVIHFYNQVDRVFTVNNSSVETLRSYGYNGEVGIIENGTDYAEHITLDTIRKYRQIINDEHNLTHHTPVLLYVGQHVWLKNIRLIIDSLLLVKAKLEDFKMIFIGEGPHKKEIIKLVNKLGLTNNILFIDKIMDRDRLKRYYARADLFLFPSSYDTVGLVVKEAAALYCPSLVLRNTNASEIIEDNINGYVADSNIKSYAERILSILNDPNKDVVSQNACQSIARSYEEIVDELYMKYQEIIKSRKQV